MDRIPFEYSSRSIVQNFFNELDARRRAMHNTLIDYLNSSAINNSPIYESNDYRLFIFSLSEKQQFLTSQQIRSLPQVLIKQPPYQIQTRSQTIRKRSKKMQINIEQSSSNSEQCSICLQQYEKATRVLVLPCLHYFHVRCVARWLRVKNYCPFCRQEVEMYDEC